MRKATTNRPFNCRFSCHRERQFLARTNWKLYAMLNGSRGIKLVFRKTTRKLATLILSRDYILKALMKVHVHMHIHLSYYYILQMLSGTTAPVY